MVLDLSHGKRLYDWLGAHKRVYRGIRWSVCFGRVNFIAVATKQLDWERHSETGSPTEG